MKYWLPSSSTLLPFFFFTVCFFYSIGRNGRSSGGTLKTHKRWHAEEAEEAGQSQRHNSLCSFHILKLGQQHLYFHSSYLQFQIYCLVPACFTNKNPDHFGFYMLSYARSYSQDPLVMYIIKAIVPGLRDNINNAQTAGIADYHHECPRVQGVDCVCLFPWFINGEDRTNTTGNIVVPLVTTL